MGHYYQHERLPRVRARERDANNEAHEKPSSSSRTRTYVKAGRSGSLLRRFGAPRWAKSYVRSLRWLCVTAPTYVFWHALAIEQAGSCGWRRLLLPCLLFALNECGQTFRLLALLRVDLVTGSSY